MVLGFSAPVWLFFSGLLLFASLVIVKFAFELVLETKRLARDIKKASSRLGDAQDELNTLVAEVDQRMSRIQATGRSGRRARRARKQGRSRPPANLE